MVGRSIFEVLSSDARVGIVLRQSKPIPPEDVFTIEEGDRLFLMAMPSAVSK